MAREKWIRGVICSLWALRCLLQGEAQSAGQAPTGGCRSQQALLLSSFLPGKTASSSLNWASLINHLDVTQVQALPRLACKGIPCFHPTPFFT